VKIISNRTKIKRIKKLSEDILNDMRCERIWVAYVFFTKLHNIYGELKHLFVLERRILKDPHK
jgi:hypothetical protein